MRHRCQDLTIMLNVKAVKYTGDMTVFFDGTLLNSAPPHLFRCPILEQQLRILRPRARVGRIGQRSRSRLGGNHSNFEVSHWPTSRRTRVLAGLVGSMLNSWKCRAGVITFSGGEHLVGRNGYQRFWFTEVEYQVVIRTLITVSRRRASFWK